MTQNKPIWNACINSDYTELEILIKSGADINVKNSDGITPLMYVALNGQNEMVKLLLDFGADRDIINNDGYKVLDLVTNHELLQLLQ